MALEQSKTRLLTTITKSTLIWDIMVLANPEIAALPAWVIALVAAGGLAAALSTAAGLLLVISTSVSHDLYAKTFNKGRPVSDKSELLLARISATVAILIAGYFGINNFAFVAQVVALRLASRQHHYFLLFFWASLINERIAKELLLECWSAWLLPSPTLCTSCSSHRNITTQTTGGLAFLLKALEW